METLLQNTNIPKHVKEQNIQKANKITNKKKQQTTNKNYKT